MWISFPTFLEATHDFTILLSQNDLTGICHSLGAGMEYPRVKLIKGVVENLLCTLEGFIHSLEMCHIYFRGISTEAGPVTIPSPLCQHFIVLSSSGIVISSSLLRLRESGRHTHTHTHL